MKVYVNIEETLSKTVEVEIPKSIKGKEEAYLYAKQQVTQAYKKMKKSCLPQMILMDLQKLKSLNHNIK